AVERWWSFFTPSVWYKEPHKGKSAPRRYAAIHNERSNAGKRIEQRHAGRGNVRHIARDERQAVYFCSRCQQTGDQRQRIGKTQQRPGFGDRFIDRQDAISKPGPHLQEPSVERFALCRIVPPCQLDTMSYFGEHEDARSDLLDRGARDPADHVWMGAVAFADF